MRSAFRRAGACWDVLRTTAQADQEGQQQQGQGSPALCPRGARAAAAGRGGGGVSGGRCAGWLGRSVFGRRFGGCRRLEVRWGCGGSKPNKVLSGAALGFDIPFSRDRWREHTPSYLVDLSVTLGVRYWGTTPMRHPRLDDTLGVTRERAMMQAWVPFVVLTWSAETHPEVIMRHRTSSQR